MEKQTSDARIYVGSVVIVQRGGTLEAVHPKAKAPINPAQLERWLLKVIREQITGKN